MSLMHLGGVQLRPFGDAKMKNGKPFPIPVRVKYSCMKCPAYCCTYAEIEVTRRDIERLARHFEIDYAQAEARYTKAKAGQGVRQLRHRKDSVFESACLMLDQETRRCTVYEARPAVCRAYPDTSRCGYYDFLKFEREQQGNPEFIARA
jgi:Fe-S-cluster containining protein